MLKKTFTFVVTAIASSLAYAERNEMVLSAGLGASLNAFTATASYTDIEYKSESGLAWSLKAGKVFSDQHAVYIHGFSNSFTTKQRYLNNNGYFSPFDLSSRLFGIGYTYYFSASSGTPYVESSTGLAVHDTDDGHAMGTGALIGAGYEFNEHIQAGAALTLSVTEDEDDSDLSYINTSISFKLEAKL